ncbi:hypothetical protein A1507_19540 [Methylomonas koyamae]|uniref:Uncharacterized protein n=1 Tax=Methylomonas koyamae TaxID=702114 RepID=A0A177N1Z0_9GAMM|nr:hypothetical protein [Methylomonas koyamae]OAI11902.1 hypothetical protein A1507_19540 [Methylomonas koyamae]
MATLAEMEAVLKNAGILFTPGVGGIVVNEFEDGFLLQNVSKDLESRQITNKQVAAIAAAFPQILSGQLERLLVRNADTTRRAIMLDQRMQSEVYRDFISLDESRSMPKPGQVDARRTTGRVEIPRKYAALEATSTKADDGTSRVTMAIWGSELSVGKNRADEAMLQLEILETDAEEIRKGRPIKEVLAGKDVHNVRVLYFDDNKVISGKERLEHHLKSLDTLEGFIVKTMSEIKCNIVGNIFMHVEDDFVDSPSIKIDIKGGGITRPKPGQQSAGKPVQRFFISMNLSPEFKEGQLQGLRRIRDSTTALFIEGLSRRDKQDILKRITKVRRQVQQALAAALKNAL